MKFGTEKILIVLSVIQLVLAIFLIVGWIVWLILKVKGV